MKKLLTIGIFLFVVILLSSCQGEQTNNIEKNTNDIYEEYGKQEDFDNSDDGDITDSDIDNSDIADIEEDENMNTEALDLVLRDLSIAYENYSINYNMIKDEIIESIGKPVETVTYPGAKDVVTFKYDGIDITFFQEHIDVLKVTGGEYSTYRGVRIGDSIEKVFECYGATEAYDAQGGEKYYMYMLPMDIKVVQLFFVVSDNEVIEYYFCNSL